MAKEVYIVRDCTYEEFTVGVYDSIENAKRAITEHYVACIENSGSEHRYLIERYELNLFDGQQKPARIRRIPVIIVDVNKELKVARELEELYRDAVKDIEEAQATKQKGDQNEHDEKAHRG